MSPNRLGFLLLPALSMGAQSLGFQGRVNTPVSNLRDAVGNKQGYGGSLVGEIAMEGGFHGRMLLGADRYPEGPTAGRVGVSTRVDLNQVSLEGLFMLQEGDTGEAKGPYVFAGLGAYGWSLRESNINGALDVIRATKMGAALGFGYRFNTHIDVEFRAFGGPVKEDFTGGGASLAVVYRF